ncbi:zinc-binding dehydrogenase [Arthrobacter sp. B0490]|nr:zinc-binding dehydrogenase [Arthrobacter sp. B0490]
MGSPKPVLAETFPLERAADAFRSSIEGHVRGKIAVTAGDEG